ncbi:hypothetical protein [Lewinella sp. IMCC34183]|nr:hypothetical protein [Lewinella sp. IMCC34183]
MQRTTPSFTSAHILQRLTGQTGQSLIRFATDRQANLDRMDSAATKG